MLDRRSKTHLTTWFCMVLLSCAAPAMGAPLVGSPGFESGDYSGWTVVSGTAWGAGPTDQRGHPSIEAWEGRYYANSYLAGEAAVGVLRSDPFTLQTPVTFLMAGWDRWPPHQPPHGYNYVTLNRASDGAELDRVWAPGQNHLNMHVLSAPEAIGEDVYIEVVDDGVYPMYSWIAVDFFVQGERRPNGDFETADFEDWNVISGTAWGDAPVTSASNPHPSGAQGDWFADTYHNGESAVGVLRSDAFALQGPIQFRIAGHNHRPSEGEFHHNYVTLNLASDDTELDRVWAPGFDAQSENAFQGRVLSSPAHVGQEVYIEAVDDGDHPAGYNWMAVDAFDITASSHSHVCRSDTWVATDALGRSLPLNDAVGPPREDRFVGIFYFTWHGEHGTQGPFDVSQIQEDHPYSPGQYPTLGSYLDELENYYGPFGEGHHWGEPLLNYYVASDGYVLRKHMQMLADAGVDTLIVDNTNGWSYVNNVLRLMSICQQIRNEGGRTPQITFLVRETIVDNEELSAVYNMIYKPGVFPDVWFRWRGKPLLLVFDAEDPPSLDLSDEILNFFTIRESWAWSDPGGWFDDGQHKWPWIDNHPQAYGWDEDPGEPEAMPVCIAQHASTNIGRSFQNGVQPPYGEAPSEQGLCFIEQSSQALAVDPEFVFVTGWNEWVAGRWELGSPGWPDYLELVGVLRGPGQSAFIDAYNPEYNRDVEPVMGGFADNYYYQMIDFIRQYKGAAQPPTPTAPQRITVDGLFDDWGDVGPEYRDAISDQARRNDHPGYMTAGPYTNLSGRNDIVAAKVTYDACNIYFQVSARDTLSAWISDDWMVLYLDIDADVATGWAGYDFVVNRSGVGASQTMIEANVGGTWSWSPIATLDYRVEGGQMEFAIPRALVGKTGLPVAFDFKWADNTQPGGDILRFTTHGDAAPNDRFNYRYVNTIAADRPDLDDDGDVDTDDAALLVAVLLDPEAFPELVSIADVNGDGSVNGLDIQDFVRIMLGC